ncbi:MAG: cbb3-type cytochrome c oxidase N-terminal domain-containing protein, partial [Sandaracinaceae bacterium]
MGEVKRRDEIQGDIIHEYDGIEEADNFLPTWWLITFYGAILFSIGYWFFYHEFQMGPTTSEQYAEDVASQTESAEADEATLVALASDPSAVAAGQETFSTTCAACHGGRGEGLIGPNLTDSAWLHGGSPVEIYTSVRRGISADRALIAGSAGMPEWGPQLGEERTRDVVAFVLSVRGTNEEGGRPPEGDVYGDGATEDGATEDGATEDGATE